MSLLGKSRYDYEDNIRIDLKLIVWEGVDSIDLNEGRYKWHDILKRVIKF
jgi:hypothetical protein